ncbi:hypothetical protein ASD67_10640 [Sphingopyxis sp. Root1497]|uniref:hypothetical protein n=1 Tax=Sphingopyxis sp. Root1497 TaxID=1736474 RepID=UPI0006F77C27|nr:hypothetical protein [Sphingopyxis sp. Root1497]KQZ65204.1 hypothetical protein ASD67_10640 [Sphingopyxis sp. Root1497]
MTRWTPKLALVALPLLAIAAPLPAHAADVRDAAATLTDPVEADRMADTVTILVDALMRTNIGPLAEAIARVDPESDAAYIPHDATLGEVTGSNPDAGRRMGDDVRATSRMAGQLATTAAAYAPVLKDMARDLAAQWQRERDAARR